MKHRVRKGISLINRVYLKRPGRVGLLFVEVYTGHPGPGEGVAVEQLSKELCHVPQLVGLQSVHRGILKMKTATHIGYTKE